MTSNSSAISAPEFPHGMPRARAIGEYAPSATQREPLAATHFAALDGLRGCAVLAVVLLHATSSLQHPATIAGGAIKKLFSCGWIGVDLFFVLSGFLITGILVDAKGRPRYFRTFYWRRSLRILPLYYGLLVVLFVIAPAVAGPAWRAGALPSSGQAWYWLHLQNFVSLRNETAGYLGNLWSLAIEEQFYLVWAPLILITDRRRAL